MIKTIGFVFNIFMYFIFSGLAFFVVAIFCNWYGMWLQSLTAIGGAIFCAILYAGSKLCELGNIRNQILLEAHGRMHTITKNNLDQNFLILKELKEFKEQEEPV